MEVNSRTYKQKMGANFVSTWWVNQTVPVPFKNLIRQKRGAVQVWRSSPSQIRVCRESK